ncbi:MAG: hypothetical protein JWQ89_1126 [Devosia sp.]|uniref:hypothetical protein n=1 Tax=Devosia sp. TaxID=1871048 RepID=UPI002611A732|nr:hypothetical protein [Devosia sp.]MDB5539399.1 hypothetical protein [Devosia sp.]
MFEHCRAFVIANNSYESRALELTAEQLGFGDVVSSYSGVEFGHSRTAITYFLLDYRMNDESLLGFIDAVRDERGARLCFSPMILFTDDCPLETMLKYVRFGFDEVIGLPERRDVLEARLMAQLNTEQIYVEANNYLGPDRRRMDSGAELRIGASAHARVVFRRDPERGVHILSREQRGHHFKPQPDPGAHFMPRLFGGHAS